MLTSTHQDTIAAIATPAGRGGIGVIRISGPDVRDVAQKILTKKPAPRLATLTTFQNQQGEAVDQGIALFFPAPHSFTGEDVLELQGHGGPIILDALLQAILACGARLARPGEFSERAFLNQKIDLTQAEAIADLIDASSQQAARSALRSLQGAFSEKIQTLLSLLTGLRLQVEAEIDFPDEEIDATTEQTIHQHCCDLIQAVDNVFTSAQQGAILREGMTVVIAGKPNAGKSSLLNCLVKRDAAIVTEIAGTTRDVLREFIQLDGMPLHIIDTAGLRESTDQVEQEGIRRARAELEKADLILWVEDAADPNPVIDEAILALHVPVLRIRNKIDLVGQPPSLTKSDEQVVIGLSAKHQQGMDLLENHLKAHQGFNASQEDVLIARRRHLSALTTTQAHLQQAAEALVAKRGMELVAEDLRLAQQALSEITGAFTSDDLLGEIFSTFCIGK